MLLGGKHQAWAMRHSMPNVIPLNAVSLTRHRYQMNTSLMQTYYAGLDMLTVQTSLFFWEKRCCGWVYVHACVFSSTDCYTVSCSSILSDATKSHSYQHKDVKQMLQQKKKPRHKHGHPTTATRKYREIQRLLERQKCIHQWFMGINSKYSSGYYLDG